MVKLFFCNITFAIARLRSPWLEHRKNIIVCWLGLAQWRALRRLITPALRAVVELYVEDPVCDRCVVIFEGESIPIASEDLLRLCRYLCIEVPAIDCPWVFPIQQMLLSAHRQMLGQHVVEHYASKFLWLVSLQVVHLTNEQCALAIVEMRERPLRFPSTWVADDDRAVLPLASASTKGTPGIGSG